MIIKKKILNKITGLEEQSVEQTEDVIQNDEQEYYQYENEDNTMYSYGENNNQNEQNFSQNYSVPQNETSSQYMEQIPKTTTTDEEVNIFDLDNIDFSQRQERRRGDRRRGFRRVDDRNLVSRAREEADAIRESAMKEGYQAGLEQANADVQELKNSLGQFINAKQEVFEYIAPDILEISVDIAQKIIKKEIEQDPQVIFNTIVDVLKTLSKEETKVTIRVSPTEINEVKQAMPGLVNLAGIETKIVVLPDEQVSEGGCLVTTTNGIVDATIESRIAVVTQALREM